MSWTLVTPEPVLALFWGRGGASGDRGVPSKSSCHAASNSARGGPENGLLRSFTGRWRCSYLMAWLDARAGSRGFLVSGVRVMRSLQMA